MDDIAKFNRNRWNDLVKADIVYSRPFLDLTQESALQKLDDYHIMGPVKDKDVLVLASGGGQQSAAFAWLGARVTVFDLSDEQLKQDKAAADHYGYTIRIEQGDMRDLSCFADLSFDIVYQAYSINFIPDPLIVFQEVARVIRPGGLYRVDFANPFVMSVDENKWNNGYPLKDVYQDSETQYEDTSWDVWHADGSMEKVPGPREFRHTLSYFLNGLISHNFIIHGIWEELSGDPQAEPGTWEHFKAVAPPWFHVWTMKASKNPD